MSRVSRIARAASRHHAAVFSMTVLMAAGSYAPAQAQKGLQGGLTGKLLPAVVVEPSVPEVRVHSPEVLVTALQNPSFTGRVVIPAGVEWDMSAFTEIPLRSRVSLVGERGALGRRPLLFTNNKAGEYSFFKITGNDVRVEGLHLRGPAGGNRSSGQVSAQGISILEDADRQLGRRVVITDNELDEWPVAGIGAAGAHAEVALPGDYDPSWGVLRPEDAGLVRIENNYIHHNAMDGLGYGVVVDGGAYVTIEGNVFDYNRHDVASDGHAHCGYLAYFNYVLEGGFQDHGSYEQHFDVHGTHSSGPGHHDGGAAGEYYLVAANAIRGDQSYGFLGHLNRPALELRGRPAIGIEFRDNVVVHDDFDSAIRRVTGGDPSLDDDNPATFNLSAHNNQFDTDHSTEIAAGDFDGDGRTDVFIATGTAWFYSRGGSQPWTYLQHSGQLTRDLAFADIDNDGITDVLWRAPNGTLSYWKGGRGSLIPLTSVPVPVSELRFGDFDGDGKTDIFYTLGRVWNIFYGRTHTWGSPGGSSFPVTELLFGDFDGDGRTDVAGVANGHWSYSSSAAQPWAPLNQKLTSSFSGAVAGDFDGDGQVDIAYRDGSTWYYSRGGRGPRTRLRQSGDLDPYLGLRSLLPGHFDGGRRDEFVSFQRQINAFSLFIGSRLVIWRGPGSAFEPLSEQDMR